MKVYVRKEDALELGLAEQVYSTVADNGHYLILDVIPSTLSKFTCWHAREPERTYPALDSPENGRRIVQLLCSPFFNGADEWEKCFAGLHVEPMDGPEFYFLVFQDKQGLKTLIRNKCIYQALTYVPSNTSKLESSDKGIRTSGIQIFVLLFNEQSRDDGLEKLEKYGIHGIASGTKGLLINLVETPSPENRVVVSWQSGQGLTVQRPQHATGTPSYGTKTCRQYTEAPDLHVAVLSKVLALPGVVKAESRAMPETS